MRKLLFSCLFCLTAVFAFAQSVSSKQASSVCQNFLMEYYPQADQKAPQFSLAEEIADKTGQVCLYRFELENPGFVIVSASEATPPILAYSFDEDFEMIPPVEGLFHLYKNEIRFAEDEQLPAKAQAAKAWKHYSASDFKPAKAKGTTHGPLLTTRWNQSQFYNTYCPWDANAGSYYDYRVPNGCVALACAQIMNYHRYPISGQGATSYIPSGYPRQTVYFSHHKYNYDAMDDEPEDYANEIAKLAYHFGVAIQMGYNYDGSGAATQEAKQQLYETFKYDQSITSYYRGAYLDTFTNEYTSRLKEEIDARRPIYYSGCTEDLQSCHAYVVDGYDDQDRFHVNFGWGGFSNGFYAIDNFVSGGSNFDYSAEAIVNIFPCGANPLTYCQGHQRNTASFGYVADGSYPTKPYPANPDCSWMVAVPHAIDYTFSFDRLDLNPNVDFVTIYNGPNESDGVLATFTGNELPSQSYTVTADSVLITFTTTDPTAQNDSYYGFLIRYHTSLEAQSCNSVNVVTDWHTIISDETAEGEDYRPQTNCIWNVSLKHIAGYAFNFPKFSLGYGDFVEIYDNTSNPPTLYKRFDIYNMPEGTVYEVPFHKMRVRFISDNWDQGDGFKMEYYAIASIDDYSGIEDLTVYPNPAADKLNLSFSLEEPTEMSCTLFDATGKMLKSDRFQGDIGGSIHSINVSDIAPGFYILEIRTPSGKQIRKVTIQ